MTTKNDGGPAFPLNMEPCRAQHYDAQGYQVHGMSLRQWYAGQAMSGLVAARLSNGGEVWWKDITAEAFEIADAMIAESERNNP
jgi:hypothetical protein